MQAIINKRIQRFCILAPVLQVDADFLTRTVYEMGATEETMDGLLMRQAASMATYSLDYDQLAARIAIAELHASTPVAFTEYMARLIKTGRMDDRCAEVCNWVELDDLIDHRRDRRFTYFGVESLKRSYLLKDAGVIIERPQHMYMRMALGIHADATRADLSEVIQTYNDLSMHLISHATPTIVNSMCRKNQLSSCFQLTVADNIETLLEVQTHAGLISKWSGGISICLTPMRATGTPIHSTGGKSSGVRNYLRVLDATQVWVDQGGHRKGAFAAYLEIWHADVITFLEMTRTHGPLAVTGNNTPNIKTALWVPDAFMRALQANDYWYLMCPAKCPDLYKVWGEAFDQLYARYVAEERYNQRIRARDLFAIYTNTVSQCGHPYWLFKDAINAKSNLQNVGTITSSNLCAEITLPTWSTDDTFPSVTRAPMASQYGVCNLAAVCLESFVTTAGINWYGLIAAAGRVAANLNKIIDHGENILPQCRRSNLMHRPIGIGIIGLADVFARLRLCYGSPEALELDAALSAAVYFGAMFQSAQLASIHGPYDTFAGSPASLGKLQPDLWGVPAATYSMIERLTGGALPVANWQTLVQMIQTTGLRNGYVCAQMPSATTSSIVGQNECFEPFTSNIYTRKTMSGEHIMVNRHLMRELSGRIDWHILRPHIIGQMGSIQSLDIPPEIKQLFLTAREIGPEAIANHAAARGPFVCQSMSLNYYVNSVMPKDLFKIIMRAWKLGLKTGAYYIHSAPAASPIATLTTHALDTSGPRQITKEYLVSDEIDCCMCST